MFPTLMLFCASCSASLSDSAICDGTRAERKAHASALIDDGGPLSQATGAVVLGMVSAGCAE